MKRLLAEEATIRRIRIDAELKSIVAKRSETARARDGKAAADIERMQAAQDLGIQSISTATPTIEYTDAWRIQGLEGPRPIWIQRVPRPRPEGRSTGRRHRGPADRGDGSVEL